MAIVAVFDMPGMNQAQYERSVEKLAGRPGPARSTADWPVPGLVSHTAAPTADGWLVVDVWDSETAFQQFSEVIMPILKDLGIPPTKPKIYPVFSVVTR